MDKELEKAKLLTMNDVADLLGCSKPHVYRLIAAESIPVVDIAAKDSKRTKRRVRLEDLIQYIDSAIKH